jgi:uncharacterized membrane protein
MKWLLYILGGIAGLLVAGLLVLLVLGSRADANRMQTSVIIHRPPDQVWPWLYERDKLKVWVSWLKDVEREPGQPQPGHTAVWTMEDMNNGGMLMKIRNTVGAVETNRRLTGTLSAPGGFHGHNEYRLTDLGGGATKVENDSRYDFDVWIAKMMAPLVMSEARKKSVSDLERLRAAVESAPTITAEK